MVLPKLITAFETFPIATPEHLQPVLNDPRLAFLIQYQRFISLISSTNIRSYHVLSHFSFLKTNGVGIATHYPRVDVF